jgi:ATP-binding cassette subfamily A (ABC1) protein 5
MSKAFQELGFCPQHDALWESITLAEHLQLYAAIKGIAKTDVPAVVS